jgi:feruloyl esterase
MTLVAWTEGAKPPAMLIARTPADEGQPAKDRPICAYPALPQYRSGDASKRSSFVCVPHSRGVDQRPADRYLN